MSPITWWTRSIIALDCGSFIVVGLGFIAKSSSNGIKSFLNSDPLSKRTRFGLGYLHNYIWSNSWEILAEDLSFTGTSVISNQPVAGSMNVMAISDNSIGNPLLSRLLICIVYGPMRSISTCAHGSTFAFFQVVIHILVSVFF